ncbi:UNKNOWN [Stylonychia lemnae]|uniref:Uncharacterized protein n=1 Tax=Stylonychia lemnae TaxID=5949 RepID=A0A078ADD7_STYLE|nr:UNKNOWN [Stylonychia lemnae]|eukprot:CDW80259.1 UNKNOWN [Stylonychia lemnae]
MQYQQLQKTFQSLVTSSFAIYLLESKSAAAQEVVMNGYGPDHFHSNQELTEVGLAGMIMGFTTIGVIMIYAVIRILVDQFETHKKYDKQLVDAIARMSELGLNIEEIDKEYENSLNKKRVKISSDEAAQMKDLSEDQVNSQEIVKINDIDVAQTARNSGSAKNKVQSRKQ